MAQKFSIYKFPPSVRSVFKMGGALWPLALQKSVDHGIVDVNLLTDLVFHMHHPELKGRKLQPDEKELGKEWEAFKGMVRQALPYHTGEKAVPKTAPSWKLQPHETNDIRDNVGGEEMLEWALTSPKGPKGIETRQFDPVRDKRKDYKAVFAWKALDASSCTARPKKRVQAVMLLRDDRGYWALRAKGSRIGTEVLTTAAQTAYRDYRRLIITKQMCPPGAYRYLVRENKKMTYEMFLGMFQLLSPHGARPTFPNLKGGGAKYGGAQSYGSPSNSAVSSVPGLLNMIITHAESEEEKRQREATERKQYRQGVEETRGFNPFTPKF